MGTAIKHPVPDWVKPSFVIFDIRALWRSVTHMATVGFKGLNAPKSVVNNKYTRHWHEDTFQFVKHENDCNTSLLSELNTETAQTQLLKQYLL